MSATNHIKKKYFGHYGDATWVAELKNHFLTIKLINFGDLCPPSDDQSRQKTIDLKSLAIEVDKDWHFDVFFCDSSAIVMTLWLPYNRSCQNH